MVLMLPLMVALNGKNVYTGISPLTGKLGEQLFNQQITVIDDPSLPGKSGSSPYDGEGIPSRPNVLVESGVLKRFFYDLKTAAQMEAESTGNGSRDLFTAPQPSATNFVLSPGETPVEQLIAGIDHGLLVDTVIGLGQGNIYSGAFSNPVALAFKIERGEIVGRVKEVSLAGNIYELLPQVEALSSEAQWFIDDATGTSCCLPYLLLPEVNVVAKE
jgi:PmbA protein